MSIKFEKVSRFADTDFNLPVRKTKNSAGYDFEVAEDIVIPSYNDLIYNLGIHDLLSLPKLEEEGMTKLEMEQALIIPRTLEEMAALTKQTKAKPTLVSTGVKCHLEEGYYLELSVRSSTPLKYWIILANSVGIIDADYCVNPDNEGEIFFQVINLSPFSIQLRKGDIIGQGIIKRYEVTDNDKAIGERQGGFGSTTMSQKMAIDYSKPSSPVGQRVNINPIDDICNMTQEQIINSVVNALEKDSQKTMSLFDACM